MAGSFNHLVLETGKYSTQLIENMRDAVEALDECYDLVMFLAEGDHNKVKRALRALNYPVPSGRIDPSARCLAALAGDEIEDGQQFLIEG